MWNKIWVKYKQIIHWPLVDLEPIIFFVQLYWSGMYFSQHNLIVDETGL